MAGQHDLSADASSLVPITCAGNQTRTNPSETEKLPTGLFVVVNLHL